jgi:hypothetical protein
VKSHPYGNTRAPERNRSCQMADSRTANASAINQHA